MVGAFPGAPGIFPGGLGIFPGACPDPEVDALSYGFDSGPVFYFSVDEWASGDGVLGPRPNVTSEGAAGAMEASADVFVYLGPPVPIPPVAPGTGPGNIAHEDGDGISPSGAPGFGLVEPNPPAAGSPDAGDNIDAYDLDTTAPGHLTGPVYFSLDSGSLVFDLLEGFSGCVKVPGSVPSSGADVLVSFVGFPPPTVAIRALSLGLDVFGKDTDDLDALAYFDVGPPGPDPGDAIFFSVRRGSAVIGHPDDSPGLIPIEEGDILAPTGSGFTPFPSVFISAEALGLGTVRSGTAGPFGADDLNALDLPEPTVLLSLGPGLMLLGWLDRRRRRRASGRRAAATSPVHNI
jgi:hypothetical protein